MADPVSIGVMGLVGMGAQAGGGLMGAIGSIMGGNAQNAMYQYQAGVAMLNKKVADQNAAWAVQAGDISAEEKGLAGAQEIATTKVGQAASGLDINTGSAARVRSDQASVSEYDQNIIRWDAAKKAYGYEVQGTMDVAQSQIDIAAGKNAKVAGEIGAVSSVLGATAGVSSKWTQGATAGVFSGLLG